MIKAVACRHGMEENQVPHNRTLTCRDEMYLKLATGSQTNTQGNIKRRNFDFLFIRFCFGSVCTQKIENHSCPYS